MLMLKGQQNSIFMPMSQEYLKRICRKSICIQSPFIINNNTSQIVNVTLINNSLTICQRDSLSNIYYYSVQLNYDVKFQVVYGEDQLTIDKRCSISQKKVGFLLHLKGFPSVLLTIMVQNTIDQWIKQLAKHLNQFGFHKLFKPIKKLGKGGFATVYQVERLADKRHFAVKAFSKQNTINSENQSQKKNLLNQIKMMRTFDNQNIIKMQGVYESENSLYVVLELLQAGQLHTKINKREGVFSNGQIKQFMIGLAKGLKEIHSNRIMHRDIKPQNIMLRSQTSFEPVIVDFGLAANVDSDDYIFYRCGTPGYVAPEVTTLVKGQRIEPECDIFSSGIIFHILLMKKPLFEGRKFEEVYQNNRKMKFNLKSSLYKDVDPEAMDLLEKMLKIDPKQRIKAHQVLMHPFLYGQFMQDEKSSLSPNTVSSQKIIF